MVSEMNHLAQVIGYAVLLFALIVGMAWSFVGVSNLTYKTLWACKYTHDFWGEVYNALWKRWYRDARKRTEGGGGGRVNFVIHIPHWFLVRATWFVVGLVAGSFIGRFAVVAFVYSAAYSGMKRW